MYVCMCTFVCIWVWIYKYNVENEYKDTPTHTHLYTVTHRNILPFKKNINFKEKMLREGIILKYFSYILINITRGSQK